MKKVSKIKEMNPDEERAMLDNMTYDELVDYHTDLEQAEAQAELIEWQREKVNKLSNEFAEKVRKVFDVTPFQMKTIDELDLI